MENEEKSQSGHLIPIEKIILDAKTEKYKLIPIASRWIEEISKKEEYKYLTFNQLLEVALRDILTGKVSAEEIQKLPKIDRKRPRSPEAEHPGRGALQNDKLHRKNEPDKKKKGK